MLQEYLSRSLPLSASVIVRELMMHGFNSVQDRQTASRPSLVPPPPPVVQSDTIAIEPEEDEDEFVYDVYYRDVGTDTSGQLSGIDTSSEAGMQRIGKLYVRSFVDTRFHLYLQSVCQLMRECIKYRAGLAADELVDNEVESEEEDEADQDSNGELFLVLYSSRLSSPTLRYSLRHGLMT